MPTKTKGVFKPVAKAAPGPDALGLVEALSETRRLFGRAPSYHSLWSAIVSGRVPSQKGVRYHYVQRSALHEVAALVSPNRPRRA